MSTFDPTARVALLPETRAYLRDWLAWVGAGAPRDIPYSRSMGLCANTNRFSKFEKSYCLLADLERAFEHVKTPFGANNYVRRAFSDTQHEDPNRLAWVRANAPEDEQ